MISKRQAEERIHRQIQKLEQLRAVLPPGMPDVERSLESAIQELHKAQKIILDTIGD